MSEKRIVRIFLSRALSWISSVQSELSRTNQCLESIITKRYTYRNDRVQMLQMEGHLLLKMIVPVTFINIKKTLLLMKSCFRLL